MKIFLLLLILFTGVQSWTKADDIRNFEIEEISIGDSILDFFSQKEINNAVDRSYEDRKYITKTFYQLILKHMMVYKYLINLMIVIKL